MKSLEIKKPSTIYSIHPLIKKRWSSRSFSSIPITEEVLMTLFEAASWASSSNNEQPWMYLYVFKQDTENFQKYGGPENII